MGTRTSLALAHLLLSASLYACGTAGAATPTAPPTPSPSPAPTATLPPTPALTSLTHAQAAEKVKAAVTDVVGPVNLFGAAVTKPQQGEWLFVVSYITALDGASDSFRQLQAEVIFAAVEGFVRADPPVNWLMVSATSAPGQGPATARVLVVERSAAEAWFTGQMNDFDFARSWMTPY